MRESMQQPVDPDSDNHDNVRGGGGSTIRGRLLTMNDGVHELAIRVGRAVSKWTESMMGCTT